MVCELGPSGFVLPLLVERRRRRRRTTSDSGSGSLLPTSYPSTACMNVIQCQFSRIEPVNLSHSEESVGKMQRIGWQEPRETRLVCVLTCRKPEDFRFFSLALGISADLN